MVVIFCVVAWLNAGQERSQSTGSSQTAAVAAPASGTETLAVRSDPDGAEVYLDGNLFGNTPAALKLTAGAHTLRVVLAGYHPWTRTIVAQAGADAHLLASLVKATPVTVAGRVLWNEQPVSDIRVRLRQYGLALEDFGSGTTDADGRFTIANVPDGSGFYLDVTGNQPMFSTDSMVPVTIQADGVSPVRDVYVCKPLVAVPRPEGQLVSRHHVKIDWQPFPEAVGYSIRVWRIGPDRQYVEVYRRGTLQAPELQSPGVQLDTDLPVGQYFWRADAFNAAGHVIGCSFNPESFTVNR